MKFFLADSAEHLRPSLKKNGIPVGRYDTFFFADRERGYRLREEVRGKKVTIIACVLPDPESLFELKALHRLAYESGATRIDLIIPYLGYARQDRPNQKGEGGLGLMVVESLRALKRSRPVIFDVHSPRIRRAWRELKDRTVSSQENLGHIFPHLGPDQSADREYPRSLAIFSAACFS